MSPDRKLLPRLPSQRSRHATVVAGLFLSLLSACSGPPPESGPAAPPSAIPSGPAHGFACGGTLTGGSPGQVSASAYAPPVAVDDTLTVDQDSGPVVVQVLFNDVSSTLIGVIAVTQPALGGTVTLDDSTGEVSFTPAPGFVGTTDFTYTLRDLCNATSTATVHVTVVAVNHPPQAVDDTFSVTEGSGPTPLDVLANDSSAPDTGETLTVSAVTPPASGGSVSIAPGNTGVIFTPDSGFTGTVTFTYTVSDGNGGIATANVTVTVVPANHPPQASDDTFTVKADSGATALDVLTNDSSAPDTGETLTVSAVTQPASGGSVSIVSGGTGVVFTPDSGFTGSVTFTYSISDGNGGTATANVTVNVVIGNSDSDNDGLDDSDEISRGTNPDNPDSDDDGIPDGVEVHTGTNPLDDDSDDDGIKDGTEDVNHNGVVDPGETNPRVFDTDGDGLSDGLERGLAQPEGTGTDLSIFTPDTDPATTTDALNPDTDGDGLKDGEEDADHNGRLGDTEPDPNDPDTDHGSLRDGDEVKAGTNVRDYKDDLDVAGHGCGSTGTGALLPLVALLAVPLLRRRRAFRVSSGAWGLLALLAAVFASAPASAQSQSIDVQQYKPGPGARDVLGLNSAQVGKHLDWNVGLSLNYAKDPLNFLKPRTDEFVYEIVRNQFTFDLMGAVSLFDRFELGVALPVTLQSSAPGVSVSPLLAQGVDATGVGDLRVVPKVHLLSTEGGMHLGLAVPVLLPTSGGKEFLGRKSVAASPKLLGEWGHEGGARVLANVGVNFQQRQEFYNLGVGNEFAYGVGGEVPFQVKAHRFAAEASLSGALGLKQASREERPLEVLAALRYFATDKLALHLGGGPGLTHGYGTPSYRLFAGAMWSEATRSIPAAKPVDSDGDGIPDVADKCPQAAEDFDGFQDEDGCPDVAPAPEPVDSDGDGITDDKDKCPQAAEDKDGFEDEDGCPDVDNDKDGIADAQDKCPNEPETVNGYQDEDGCPDQKPGGKVQVVGEKIVITEKVYFATNQDVILPRSFPLLQQVAQLLRVNPRILKVRVEGHTDSQGPDDFNMDLSRRRANSVLKMLEKEGIAPERLEAVGYGETTPVDTNDTPQGRENNRRVEFTILETKPVEEAPPAQP